MTREELEKRLESAEKQMIGLQDEIQNLKKKLAEVHDEPEIPDFPEFNNRDIVYALDACFDVVQEEHGGGKGDKDFTGDDALFYNNFHTADYAHEFRRKCMLIAMTLHCKWYLDRDYVPDWDNRDEIKWDVFFDSKLNKFRCSNWRSAESSCVYFSSDIAAKKCAEWMNEHWRDSE